MTDLMVEHDGAVYALAWAHPRFGSGLLASGGYDNRVVLYSQDTATRQWTVKVAFDTVLAAVNDLEFSPEGLGLCLAVASSDGFINCFDYNETSDAWEPYSYQYSAQAVNSIAWNPVSSLKMVAVGGCNTSVGILGIREDRSVHEIVQLRKHTDWVTAVSWGGLLGDKIASCGNDGLVYVWSLQHHNSEKEESFEMYASWSPMLVLQQAGCMMKHVSFNPTGSLLAVTKASSDQQKDGYTTVMLEETVDDRWIELKDDTGPVGDETEAEIDDATGFAQVMAN